MSTVVARAGIDGAIRLSLRGVPPTVMLNLCRDDSTRQCSLRRKVDAGFGFSCRHPFLKRGRTTTSSMSILTRTGGKMCATSPPAPSPAPAPGTQGHRASNDPPIRLLAGGTRQKGPRVDRAHANQVLQSCSCGLAVCQRHTNWRSCTRCVSLRLLSLTLTHRCGRQALAESGGAKSHLSVAATQPCSCSKNISRFHLVSKGIVKFDGDTAVVHPSTLSTQLPLM